MEFITEYGLFLAKSVTWVVALLVIISAVAAAAMKQKHKAGSLELKDLSKQLAERKEALLAETLSKDALKQLKKEQKKAAKARKKCTDKAAEKRTFVLTFKGSMDAHEVDALREEVSAVLTIADKERDEVLLNLESPGGMVMGYGLAASQLSRLREAGIPLTVAVDKVAASGGYMMACIADRIIAAPFAIVGSIGVIAQLPNFNKLLKKKDIEFEQHTAGEFKRTLTMFGENTEQAREKFRQELELIHQQFKHHIVKYRPSMNIDEVATGEHWLGEKAFALGLVDGLGTSDDLLLQAANEEGRTLYEVHYLTKKKLSDRVAQGVGDAAIAMCSRFWNRF